MTPDAQRIAIAEACKHADINGRTHVLVNDVIVWHVPDYLNDLNAMHEAEEVLDANQQCTFACLLTEPVRDEIYEVMPRDLRYTVCFPALHATASQRAEAFLRTLNLWTD